MVVTFTFYNKHQNYPWHFEKLVDSSKTFQVNFFNRKSLNREPILMGCWNIWFYDSVIYFIHISVKCIHHTYCLYKILLNMLFSRQSQSYLISHVKSASTSSNSCTSIYVLLMQHIVAFSSIKNKVRGEPTHELR